MIIYKKEDIHQIFNFIKRRCACFQSNNQKERTKSAYLQGMKRKKKVYTKEIKKVVCRRKEINNVVY